MILSLFFDPTTSFLSRYFIRGLWHSMMVFTCLEVCFAFTSLIYWYGDPLPEKKSWWSHETSRTSFVLFVMIYAYMSVYGRLMQSGERTVGGQVLLELAGTITELSIADTLLQGTTPGMQTWKMFKDAKREVGSKGLGVAVREFRGLCVEAVSKVWMLLTTCNKVGKGGAVVPSDAVEPIEGRSSSVSLPPVLFDERSYSNLRKSYAINCLLAISLVEGVSIIAASAFAVIHPVSYGTAGTPPLSLSSVLSNFFIMFLGELVLTDGMVSKMSVTFSHRYIVDLPSAWARRGITFRFIYPVIAIAIPGCLLDSVQDLCLTAWVGKEDLVAITNCPLTPAGVGFMSRIGAFYAEAQSVTQGP